MGSLRNPIGPLPSSIYWRRRAVALSLVALLALLVLWVVNLGGSGGDKASHAGKDDRGEGAASSITPGPTSSEPVNGDRPGGRDEEEPDDEAGSGGDAAGSGEDGKGPGEGSGGGDGDGDGGSDGAAGSGGGDSGGSGGGEEVDGLAACRTGQARVSLTSVKNTYAPGEKPRFRLTVENIGGSDCRVDVHGSRTVFTISDSDDETVWSSEHCATKGSTPLRVAARGKRTYTVEWDRKRSTESCGTPASGSPASGSYLVQASVPQLGSPETPFVLTKD